MNPLFTIAIPTYNNLETISSAIDSCISQKFEGMFEVLIVDNCSDDGTSTLLEGYVSNERVSIVRNVTTVPLFENHNICFSKAKGRYVLFCHSDDTLDPNALNIINEKLKSRSYPENYILWGHSLFRDFSQSINNAGFRTGELFCGAVATKAFLSGGLTPSGTCYSYDFYKDGGFLPTKHRTTPSDASSMIRAALNGFRFEMYEEIVFYRHYASTAIENGDRAERFKAHVETWDTLIENIAEHQIFSLINQAYFNKRPPLYLYYSVSKKYPRKILRGLFKSILNRPNLLWNYLFWEIIVLNIKNKRS